MIVTARQIEDMQKDAGSGARIVLPYRARLTPLAMDFVRARKIEVGYSDEGDSQKAAGGPADSPGAVEPARSIAVVGQYLWWTDGPAGPAKAALTAEEHHSSFSALSIANDDANLISAIRTIAREIKSGKISGAVLLVKSAARAGLFANRCPSIRAVIGTCMETVEQGVEQIAANVLIIEYPHKTLSQIRNLLSRFLRPARKLSPQLELQLKELASCG